MAGAGPVEDELFGLPVSRSRQAQRVHELPPVDADRGQPRFEGFVTLRAVVPKDVRSLATVADAHVEPLPDRESGGP
jgi:hypothetical protein